jgi:hypothetical protein
VNISIDLDFVVGVAAWDRLTGICRRLRQLT